MTSFNALIISSLSLSPSLSLFLSPPTFLIPSNDNEVLICFSTPPMLQTSFTISSKVKFLYIYRYFLFTYCISLLLTVNNYVYRKITYVPLSPFFSFHFPPSPLTFTATRYLPPYTPHVGPLDPVKFKEATLFTCIRVH